MDRTVSVTHPGPHRLRASLPHLALLASLPLLGAAPLRAAPELPPFPPSADFRSLQLITLACSRENTAEPCDKARSLANPLLDHPRLPASCKDTLWTIRQRSVVAASNSFARREPIDRAARSLTAVCRQQLPTAKPASDAAPRPQGGLNLINPNQN
ncbi:hypothetical protein [Cyanobium gracile]|uniref:Uncharacterized protein n=1 Tax=Cyanobium gracile UHCC 0281 TaxID=3110309 RepID=A0ABU5SS99_9CYAN|nr:hypothetical protein [Cyanobium gracile]MEA5441303.1 hypothetical protein [Cyanobium gracile UHCC 0281]